MSEGQQNLLDYIFNIAGIRLYVVQEPLEARVEEKLVSDQAHARPNLVQFIVVNTDQL